MTVLVSIERVIVTPDTSATQGRVTCQPVKAVWVIGHGMLGLAGAILFAQWDALLVFLALTALTICAGHSVGMHRLLIHRSFETFRLVEYLLVWLGTLVGMAGPIGMIRAHDMRDWHQRQNVCPPHPSHDANFWQDAWWQMCCEFRLDHPPEFRAEPRVSSSRFYQCVERTWMAQQILVAVPLFAIGGWAWVLWGVSLRIFVSLTGHWMVGHFAHRRGHQGWRIEGLPVQGYNLPRFGWLTFGESWHGNHHAFPHSSRLGVEAGQADPGYWFILALERLGVVWSVKVPESEAERAGLERVTS